MLFANAAIRSGPTPQHPPTTLAPAAIHSYIRLTK